MENQPGEEGQKETSVPQVVVDESAAGAPGAEQNVNSEPGDPLTNSEADQPGATESTVLEGATGGVSVEEVTAEDIGNSETLGSAPTQVFEPESSQNGSDEEVQGALRTPSIVQLEGDEDQLEPTEVDEAIEVSEPLSPGDNPEPMQTLDEVAEEIVEETAAEEPAPRQAIDEDDYSSVASFYNIDDALLRTLEPTVFDNLLARFNEYQAIKSDSQLLELSMEQLKHSAQNRERSLSTDQESLQLRLEELQRKVFKLEEENKADEQKLQASNEKVEREKKTISALTVQLQQSREEKANAYEMLSSKQEQLVGMNDEIKSLTESNRELRQRLSKIDSDKEGVNAELIKEKFSKTKLERELALSQQSSAWYENELKRRSDELSAVRESKRTEVVSLRTRLDKVDQEYNSSKASNERLEKSLHDLEARDSEHVAEIKKLNDKVAQLDHEYIEELSKKETMIQVLQNSSDDRKKRIESLQKVYEETTDKVKKDEETYKQHFESLKDEIANRETRIKDLEETVADLSTVNITSGNVETSNILGDLTTGPDEEPVTLTPSSQKVLKSVGLTDIVTDTNRIRKDLSREKRARKKAESELKTIFKELERRMPLLKSYKDKCADLEMKQAQFEVILDNLAKEKSVLRTQLSISSKKADELQSQVRQLSRYKGDLQRQLATLLSEVTLQQQGGNSLTNEEKEYIGRLVEQSSGDDANTTIDPDTTDTGKLISDRLATFKDIRDLIAKNEQLLTVSRKLGNELESRESGGSNEVAAAENQALEKSRQAIEKLQDQLQSTKSQLEAVSNSRDMLQQLVERGGYTQSSAGSGNATDQEATSERISQLVEQVKEKQSELNDLKRDSESKLFDANMKIQDLISEKSGINLELAKVQSSAKLLEEKTRSVEYIASTARAENSQLKQNATKLQDNLGRLEMRSQMLNDQLLDARSTQANTEVQLRSLAHEKQLWKETEERMSQEINKLVDEKNQANVLISKLQALDSERQASFQDSMKRLSSEVDRLQSQLDIVRRKLDASTEETKQVLHSKNADSRAYQERIDTLTSELDSARSSLHTKSNAFHELSKSLEDLQAKYNEMADKRQTSLDSLKESNDASNEGIAALKQELSNALDDSKMHAQNAVQYKQIASAAEKELNSLNETYAQYKATAEEKLTAQEKELTHLRAEVKTLTEQKAALERELQETKQNYESEKSQSESKVRELNTAVSTFDSIKKDYESRISTLEQDSSSKEAAVVAAKEDGIKKAAEADSTRAQAALAQEKCVNLEEKLRKLDEELKSTAASLASAQQSYESEKTASEEKLRQDKLRITELDAQNRTLMNQLEGSPMDFGSTEEGSDMKDLLSYLHRENDSLSQQLEYARSEEKRMRQSIESLQRELGEVKSQLGETKEQAVTAEKYTVLLNKMQAESTELSVYKENNKALRAEVKTYLDRAEVLENQLTAAQARSQELEKADVQLQNELKSKDSELALSKSRLDVYQKQLEQGQGDNAKAIAEETAKLESEYQAKYKGMHDKLVREFQEKLNAHRAEKKKAQQEKDELARKVADLEAKSTASSDGNNAELKAAQEESAKLKQEVAELSAQVSQLTEQSKKAAEEAAQKSSTADKTRDEFQQKVRAQELENTKKKLEAETAEYKKKLDEESDALKKKLADESEQRLQQEIEAYKKRVRAPSNARISEVIEQRWKARSAELDSQYEAKVKDLEAKSGSAGLGEDEKKKLEEKFEKEKEQLRKDVSAAVRKEVEFKQTILQRQLGNLKEQLKRAKEAASSASPAAEAAAPVAQPTAAPSFIFGGASSTGNPFMPPTAPEKRANDDEGGDDKRAKTS